MAETDTVDDLSAPLGQKTARKRRFRLPFSAMQVLAVAFGLFLAVFAGFAIFGNNPLGGEPVARIALRESKPSEDKAAPDHGAKATPKQAPSGEPKTVTIIDGSSGARHDVAIGSESADKASGDTSQGDKIQGNNIQGNKIQGDKAEGDSPAFAKMAGIDPLLLEKSRYGMIPVISDGRKPFTVYAAPSDPAKAAKMPVVAIVIGGLGVGAAKTADAIMKLPPAVTLAFTPYGSDPSKLAERARAQRHEILLQIPMEPYDYPDNDPGPQTLLATLSPEQNLDRFFWHLGRLQGYAAIANFMGARFVATDAAMQPIIREASKRGLGYFDDGTAPRSVAAALAMGQGMPFAKSDVAIDAVPTPAEIDHALADLENLAKERGVAIGTASALPVSIERIGIWIKTLEARGVMLVPLTTAMLKSKSS
jgi:polysaccharide deacetylase 2 family uncharacterized protein YibQ